MFMYQKFLFDLVMLCWQLDGEQDKNSRENDIKIKRKGIIILQSWYLIVSAVLYKVITVNVHLIEIQRAGRK